MTKKVIIGEIKYIRLKKKVVDGSIRHSDQFRTLMSQAEGVAFDIKVLIDERRRCLEGNRRCPFVGFTDIQAENFDITYRALTLFRLIDCGFTDLRKT